MNDRKCLQEIINERVDAWINDDGEDWHAKYTDLLKRVREAYKEIEKECISGASSCETYNLDDAYQEGAEKCDEIIRQHMPELEEE